MKSIAGFVLIFCSAHVAAAELVIPNTFSAGTPAKAADVNANFNAVKGAVDGADTRLNALEGDNTVNKTDISTLKTDVIGNSSAITTLQSNMNGKQAVLSNSCEVGSAIRAIDPNGTVTCESIIKAGKSIIQPLEFRMTSVATEVGGYCTAGMGDHASMGGTNSQCSIFAPVHFPHGVLINNFQCYIYMDTTETSARVLVSLERNPLNGGFSQNVATGTTVGTPLGFQTTVPSSSLSNNVIDNNQYYYRVRATFLVTGVALNAIGYDRIRLYNCTADYTMQ